jgi:hypothetical protein
MSGKQHTEVIQTTFCDTELHYLDRKETFCNLFISNMS